MYRVITISRQYGSGGGEIAQRLADRLGWRLVSRSVLDEIAARARISPAVAAEHDERVDPWFQSMVRALWQGGFEGAASTTETVPIDSETIAKYSAQIVQEAALVGNAVIVGRGAQCILHDRQDTFHVSIYAPHSLRIANLRKRLPEGANVEGKIDETDRQRASYVRRFFNRDWTDRRLYHLCVCASVGVETAVEAILCAAGLPSHSHP